MTKKLFCFGLGYSAGYLADICIKNGWEVEGTYAHSPKEIRSYPFDKEHKLEKPLSLLQDVTHILISIPPEKNTDQDLVLYHHLYDLLELKNLEWVGYLSSTGVYGDHQNAWVDETGEVRPSNPRTVKRLKCEREWSFLKEKLPIHIFRLGGIYGPGRNMLDRILNETYGPIDDEGHYFSRIYVEDIAGALWQSMQNPTPGEIYNLVDDQPSSQYEMARYAYELLGKDVPEFTEFSKADLSPMMMSFYQDKRRVRNVKIKEKLGYEFRAPTYREALQKILIQKKLA